MACAGTGGKQSLHKGIALQRLNKRLTRGSSASMRLCCQCPRPQAGRLVPIRPARLIAASVAAVVLGVFSLTVTAPPASAKSACWQQILNEWVDTSNVSPTYPLHCYGEAVKHVPQDLAQYSSIIEDILAARQQASRLNLRRPSGVTPSNTTSGAPADPSSGVYNSAIDKLSPTNSDSMPLPLLILAGLALVMVAAGGAGLLSRHLKARKAAG